MVDVASAAYAERVYAAIVGKVLGVYLGRPVEGWPYSRVRDQFGLIHDFPAKQLDQPLIVADDDISASFVFPRLFEVAGELPIAERAGHNWLNYIIEGRSVLWWGGLGRSTEHTALVNLKHGMPAPASGSSQVNGQVLAEQIGALIFNDMFALLYPGDPLTADRVTREAASVSHDGAAVDAAGYLAALRALLFTGLDLRRATLEALPFATDPRVVEVIERTVELTDQHRDWREVRDALDAEFGYAVMPGPCHVLSNLGVILMGLLMGDDVLGCAGIAASAGFDSDSNAGVVGGTAALAFGPAGLESARALRDEMADRMLVVSADGGECVTDAAREAARLIAFARGERTLSGPRFGFGWHGATHGFQSCPYADEPGAVVIEARDGLRVQADPMGCAISTPTFLEPGSNGPGFSTIASPTLYPGQITVFKIEAEAPTTLVPYVVTNASTGVQIVEGDPMVVPQDEPVELAWRVPQIGKALIVRLGLRLVPERPAEVRVTAIDWVGAPERFEVAGLMQADIWDINPLLMQAWVSGADNFEADYEYAVAIAQTRGRGAASIGSRDWVDYQVSAKCRPSLHAGFGLTARATGLRRYYALLLRPGVARLISQLDGTEAVLASAPVEYDRDQAIDLRLACCGDQITAEVAGIRLTATDQTHRSGGAGLLVEEGSFAADHFLITTTANERTTP